MREIYEAYDGTRFDNEDDCWWYENAHYHKDIFNIKFLDINNNELHLTYDYDINEDVVYQTSEKVIIDNIKQVKDLHDISDECGWCEFNQITSPGTWIRTEDEMKNGVWKNIESN